MTDIQHFSKIVKATKFTMFTTTSEEGALVSRPMTMQEMEFDGDLWFFAGKDSEVVAQIADQKRVNLSFANLKSFSFLSAQGRARLVEDKAKAAELWNPLYKAWFPNGLEDANLGLIKVSVESADYWESPNSAIVRMLGFAKAIVTGDRNNAAIGKHGHINIR